MKRSNFRFLEKYEREIFIEKSEDGLSALPLLSVVSRAASGVVGSSGVVGRALEGQRAAFVPF